MKNVLLAIVLFVCILGQVWAEPSGMEWVDVDDPGVPGHEPFNGYMSKYETTNAQYCEFLIAAKISGDIVVDGDYVKGAIGTDFVGQVYYNLSGSGLSGYGAINGGAARINFNLFGVNSPPLGAKSKMKIHHDTPFACGGEIHWHLFHC